MEEFTELVVPAAVKSKYFKIRIYADKIILFYLYNKEETLYYSEYKKIKLELANINNPNAKLIFDPIFDSKSKEIIFYSGDFTCSEANKFAEKCYNGLLNFFEESECGKYQIDLTYFTIEDNEALQQDVYAYIEKNIETVQPIKNIKTEEEKSDYIEEKSEKTSLANKVNINSTSTNELNEIKENESVEFSNFVQQLQKYKMIVDEGLLNDNEYEIIKIKLIEEECTRLQKKIKTKICRGGCSDEYKISALRAYKVLVNDELLTEGEFGEIKAVILNLGLLYEQTNQNKTKAGVEENSVNLPQSNNQKIEENFNTNNSTQQFELPKKQKDRSTSAMIGCVLGIINIIICWIPYVNFLFFPFTLIGLVLSLIGNKSKSRGMFVVGLIFNALSIAFSLVMNLFYISIGTY